VPSVKDVDLLGHPSTNKAYNNVGQVKELIVDNRKVTTLEVVNILEMSFKSV